MKNRFIIVIFISLLFSSALQSGVPLFPDPATVTADTACRDTSVCLTGNPFNLNLLCRPTGGIYYGSPAILGGQFNPVSANIGANLVKHGFIQGIDTIVCCTFTISVADTVYPAGLIHGQGGVCRQGTEIYSIDKVINATSYIWSFSGGPLSDTITNIPSLTLNFNSAFNSGLLRVRGMRDLCAGQGVPSEGFFIQVHPGPVASVRNVNDSINLTDNVCKNERCHYYVVEELAGYKWTVEHGRIVGDSLSRNVAVDWGGAEGSGILQVEVADQYGCSASSLRNVTILSGTAPAPSLVWLFGANMLVCSDSTVNSYQWYNDNVLIQGATKRYYLADTGNRKCYNVQTCLDACCNTSEPFCFFPSSAIGEPASGEIRVFPNPAGDWVILRVASQEVQPGQVALFNQYGILVMGTDVAGCEVQINLTGLPRGLYIIRYLNKQGRIYFSRIIKL